MGIWRRIFKRSSKDVVPAGQSLTDSDLSEGPSSSTGDSAAGREPTDSDSPEDEWYVLRKGQRKIGPLTLSELTQRFGHTTSADAFKVRKGRHGAWIPAVRVAEVFSELADFTYDTVYPSSFVAKQKARGSGSGVPGTARDATPVTLAEIRRTLRKHPDGVDFLGALIDELHFENISDTVEVVAAMLMTKRLQWEVPPNEDDSWAYMLARRNQTDVLMFFKVRDRGVMEPQYRLFAAFVGENHNRPVKIVDDYRVQT